MAAEEVGARLVAYGEEEFVTAFRDCQKAIDQYAASMVTADKKTEQAAAGMDTAKKKFTIFGQSLTDIKSGFEMAFGAFEKGYGFVKTFIDAASNMNETTSKSSVVFGEMAGAVEDMGSRAAQSMGLSKQEAIAAAATYGNLFVSMGMAKDVSADMSMNLVQLAADFASFNNIPVADALDKIRAGLVGESEPLKSLGVNINEASLKQEALALGLIKGNEALSASAKAQAAYSLMLKQSTTAQGDFARTADGIANQQRILEAQTKNLTAAIGQNLLPVWKEMLKVINQSASTLNLIMTRDQQLQDVLQDHSQQVVLNTTNYKDYIKEMTRAANVAGFGVNANGDLTKSYKTWYGVVTEVVKEHALLTEAQIKEIQAAKQMDQALKDTKDAAQVTAAGFDEFSSSLGQSSLDVKNWADYMKNEAAEAAELVKSRMDSLTQSIEGKVGKALTDYNEKNKDLNLTISTTAQRIQELSKLKAMTPEQATNLDKYWKALEKSKDATFDLANASKKEMPAALERMNTALSKIIDGPVSFKSAAEAVKFFQDKVNLLSSGIYLTEDQKKELDALKGKLGEAEAASAALKLEFEDASRRMIFSMIQTKLASDGLTKDEVDNLIRLAEHWGLVDTATATTAQQINALDLSSGRAELGSIDSILTHMNGLPRNYNYEFTTRHIDIYEVQSTNTDRRYGGETYASGGTFTIPDWYGYEGYPLGPGKTASGGEQVIVLPKSMSAGPAINNYSNAYNYNLNVMTSQSPQVVQQSFAMMKLLAG